MQVIYRELNRDNFHPDSLDGFIRHQEVSECWRKVDGAWKLLPIAFTEDWGLGELRELAGRIAKGLGKDLLAWGAFEENQIVGFAVVVKKRFGSRNQYVDLAEFYVSQPFRRQGIGRTLFEKACEGAGKLGAEKLYISAHSSKESQAAYRGLGCVEAGEINSALAAKEPCDVQMEYDLSKEGSL